jgi:hypothetical protein
MKAYLYNKVRNLRTNAVKYLIILVLVETTVIALLKFDNVQLLALYEISVKDNVELVMRIFELEMQCQSPEGDEREQDLQSRQGFYKL